MPNISIISPYKLSKNNFLFFDSTILPIRQPKEYCLFGAPMPGRNYQSSTPYRYGMNGQEKDDEIAGNGNIYSAEFWEYDARTGRRWNQDPVTLAPISPYATFLNNPILFSDPNGDVVKYDKFRDRVNAFFGKMFNKGFRENFKKWDESADVYTLRKSKDFGKDKLVDAPVCEGACNNGIQDNAIYYDRIGEFSVVEFERGSKEKKLKGHQDFKEGKIETVTEEFDLKKRVPNTDILINAAHIPDEFSATDANSGSEILAPVVLGDARFTDVHSKEDMPRSKFTAGDVKVRVKVVSKRVNDGGKDPATNTDFDIKYQKYTIWKTKIKSVGPKIK